MPSKNPKKILEHILAEFREIETTLEKLKKKAGDREARVLEAKIVRVKGVKRIVAALCTGSYRRAFS